MYFFFSNTHLIFTKILKLSKECSQSLLPLKSFKTTQCYKTITMTWKRTAICIRKQTSSLAAGDTEEQPKPSANTLFTLPNTLNPCKEWNEVESRQAERVI